MISKYALSSAFSAFSAHVARVVRGIQAIVEIVGFRSCGQPAGLRRSFLGVCSKSISLLSVFLLVACGFHLRGHVPLPHELSPMYIETTTPYNPLVQLLKDNLDAYHIVLTDSPNAAKTILRIVDIQFSETLISVSASTNTRQYALAETMKIEMVDQKGKMIIPLSTLSANNPLTVDSNEVLTTSSQKQSLTGDMQNSLVQQLMARLASQNTKRLLQGT